MAADRKLCEECEAIFAIDGIQHIDDDQLPRLLGHCDGNKVILVCGNDLKVEEDMDFVEGGNDLEAEWIRRRFGDKSIIVDYAIHNDERKFICFHECCERRKMAGGMEYGEAHDFANKEERAFRLADDDEDEDDHSPPMHYGSHEEVSPEVRERVATGIAMGKKKSKSINVSGSNRGGYGGSY